MKNKFFPNLFSPKASSEVASSGSVQLVAHGATGAAPSAPAVPDVQAVQSVPDVQAQIDTAIKAERQRFRSFDALARSFPGQEKQIEDLRYSGADAGSAILALTEERDRKRLEVANAVNADATGVPDFAPATTPDATASGDGAREQAEADEKTFIERATATARRKL